MTNIIYNLTNEYLSHIISDNNLRMRHGTKEDKTLYHLIRILKNYLNVVFIEIYLSEIRKCDIGLEDLEMGFGPW